MSERNEAPSEAAPQGALADSRATAGAGAPVPAAPGPESALPPAAARVIAFVSIVVAGVCGGLIGFALVDIGYAGTSSTPLAVGALVGAIVSALGVAVVAVLVLRAMGEWRTIEHGRAGRRAGRGVAEDSAPHPRLRARPKPGAALEPGPPEPDHARPNELDPADPEG